MSLQFDCLTHNCCHNSVPSHQPGPELFLVCYAYRIAAYASHKCLSSSLYQVCSSGDFLTHLVLTSGSGVGGSLGGLQHFSTSSARRLPTGLTAKASANSFTGTKR